MAFLAAIMGWSNTIACGVTSEDYFCCSCAEENSPNTYRGSFNYKCTQQEALNTHSIRHIDPLFNNNYQNIIAGYNETG